MKLNRTVKGVGVALVLFVSVAFAAVNGVFANVSASGFVHSVTEMTAPIFNGALNGNASTATALNTAPSQCSGGTPLSTGVQANGNANCTAGLARVCNANGCYIEYPDGSFMMWGKSTNGSGSGSANTLTVTFPASFTTTTNLSLQLTPIGSPGGDGNPHPMSCHADSISTTGASVVIAIPGQIGGSGYASPVLTSQYCSFIAFGN